MLIDDNSTVSVSTDIASGCNAQGLFDRTCALQLTKQSKYLDIIQQTTFLQSADLLQMNRIQRKCFYGNLLSLMNIHCFINHFIKMEAQASLTM